MRKFLLAMIFVLAGTNVFAMTFKTGDDTIDLYGSLRAFSVFNYTDRGDRVICGGADRNCSQFLIGLQGNSRAGVRWTHGDFFVNNEWGMGGSDTTPGLSLRLMYGDYKFAGGDSGRIRIGQSASIAQTYSSYDRKLNADNGLLGFGAIGEARRAGINYEIGGFSISAISMRQDVSTLTGASGVFTNSGLSNISFREIMPRIEAAYSVSSVKIAGSFVNSSVVADNITYTSENDTEIVIVDERNTVRNKRYSVNAGHIMFLANPKIGENARLIASGFYSVNGGIYQMVSIGGGFSDNEAVGRSVGALPLLKELNGDKITWNNTTVYGGAVAVVVDKFEAGYGIQSAANDAWDNNQTGMGIYANYKFRVSNNFRITPEFAYLHSGNLRGNKDVKDTRGVQAGVQFRFDI